MRYGFIHQMPSKFQTDFIVIPGRSEVMKRARFVAGSSSRSIQPVARIVDRKFFWLIIDHVFALSLVIIGNLKIVILSI